LAAVVCLSLAGAAPDAGVDPRLLEAQRAFDEAAKLKDGGKYADGASTADRACSLWEAVLGAEHLEVAKCLNLAGDLHRRAGDLAGAERLIQRALSIQEAALGRSHPDVAVSLTGLGILQFEQGHYEQAEALYRRALAIRETALGKSHVDVAISLNNLGGLFLRQGSYRRAQEHYERALAIREAALGPSHPLVAQVLGNLGIVYGWEGRNERAEQAFERALEIREAALGPSHPDLADSLNNLGVHYVSQGRYDRAEAMYRRTLEIREAAYGKSHSLVSQTLSNLATLYEQVGQDDRARALYERALEIREATLGPSHPDVALVLNNLAALDTRQGRFDRALSGLQRALAIRESSFGASSPEVAETLHCQANLHVAQGAYDRAEPLYERALAIREATYGPSNPLVAEVLDKLAVLQLRRRRVAGATPLLMRSLAISEGRLRRDALHFSEARLASFLKLLATNQQPLYALAREHPDDPEVRRLALTSLLAFQGRSVEQAADTSRSILQSLGPQDREVFDRLRELRTRLARLSLAGPDDGEAPAAYQQRLAKLAEEGDALEADLAKRSAPLRALVALPPAAELVQRVADALPRNGALVEIAAFVDRPLNPKPGTPEIKLPAQPRYLAMALFPDGRTGAVDLGPAAPIDAAAATLRDALAEKNERVEDAARKLYRLAFKPVRSLLGKTRKVYLSPDDQLSLIPFAALHDGRGFLVDAFDFTYLTSGRDLLPRPGAGPRSSSVVVLADPAYGAATAQGQAAAGERSYRLDRFLAEQRAGLSGPRWAPLPGTRQEAETIQALLPQAQLFVGADASKDRLLHLASPGILHVATHGFFMADEAGRPGGRGIAEVGPTSGSIPRPADPLLRSGLVLAGAGAGGAADLGNSLVTALELAGLDLWGTELVVLSACDTGRGDVRRGQGVYGLRRALVVAGAETVVVSLWKVDDEATKTMMERYYRNLLAGQGRAEALKGAMLALRATHPHPHFWAPFIAIGQDAPLRALAAAKRSE